MTKTYDYMGLIFPTQDKDGDGESETSHTVPSILAYIWMATVHPFENCVLDFCDKTPIELRLLSNSTHRTNHDKRAGHCDAVSWTKSKRI